MATAKKCSVLVPVGKRIETTPTKQCLSGFDFAVVQGYVIGTGHHVQGSRAGAKQGMPC